MVILWQGIYWGLLLAILVGQLLVALIQASLEQGTKAGISVGLGIWFSDFLFIISVYLGMNYVNELLAWDNFELVVGIIGALVLIGAGIGTVMTKPPELDTAQQLLGGAKKPLALFTKGFLINTINPFTLFFWVSVMTSVILKNDYDTAQASLFFTGILGTIVFTDSLKIFLAKKIRHRLTSRHLWWVRRVAGIVLIVFGIALALKVMF